MKQKRRSWEEENKEKYCRFWYEWQPVVRSKKFELWLDVEAPLLLPQKPLLFFLCLSMLDQFISDSTLLNAKRCSFLLAVCLFSVQFLSARLCLLLYSCWLWIPKRFLMLFMSLKHFLRFSHVTLLVQTRHFLLAEFSGVLLRAKLLTWGSRLESRRGQIDMLQKPNFQISPKVAEENWSKVFKFGLVISNNMCSLRRVFDIVCMKHLLYMMIIFVRKKSETIEKLLCLLASERRKSNSLFWWHFWWKRKNLFFRLEKGSKCRSECEQAKR